MIQSSNAVECENGQVIIVKSCKNRAYVEIVVLGEGWTTKSYFVRAADLIAAIENARNTGDEE